MQRWDYLILGILRSYGINYRVNGDKVGDWKDMPLHDVFNRLGKQGYEFVGYDGENYIFKRPAPALKPLDAAKEPTKSDVPAEEA